MPKPTIRIDVDTSNATRRLRPNRDLDAAGYSLQHVIAFEHAQALEHIGRELSAIDGFGSGAPEVAVTGSSELTGPERYADARWSLTSAREALQNSKATLLEAMRNHHEMCVRINAMRVPKDVVKPQDRSDLCCSHQGGKHAVIEWGDAFCMDRSYKSGLCARHYQAWYRARKRDGIDTSKDFEPLL